MIQLFSQTNLKMTNGTLEYNGKIYHPDTTTRRTLVGYECTLACKGVDPVTGRGTDPQSSLKNAIRLLQAEIDAKEATRNRVEGR